MQEIPLPFGEWLPDLGENENPGLVEAKNVIARPGGYEPIKDLTGAFSELEVAVTDNEADVRFYGYASGIGDFYASVDSIFIGANPGSPTAVTSLTGLYSGWHFATFNGAVYGIRQFLSASTNALYYANPGDITFTNFTTTPLSGAAIARVGNFLMIGAIDGGDGLFQFRWSGFNQPLSWAVSQTTQAGLADVERPELGEVTGIAGGRYGIIFQGAGATRIEYVGPPRVWRGTVIDADYGCIYQNSIITVEDATYYISRVGPMVTTGAAVQRLGTSRVTDWFFDNFSESNKPYLHVARDIQNNTIVWSWSTSNGAAGTFKQLIYSLETSRFTNAEIDAPRLLSQFSPLVAATYQPLLGLKRSGVPAILRGRQPTGSTLAAEVTTGYTSLVPGQRVAVNAVEPVYDGAGAKVAVNAKATQAGAASAGTPVAVNSLGIANVRADGRLAAVSVTFDAGAEWSELKGAVVTADTSGAR
jgi:hypothetical protein